MILKKEFKFQKLIDSITAFFAILSGWGIYIAGRNSAPFIDEVVLNIPAAKNFFLYKNYTYSDWGDFSPIISTGLWCSFPSGIAAAFFDAPLVKIRFVSYLFSTILIFAAVRIGLSFFNLLSKLDKNIWAIIFTGLFFSLIPYAEGAFMTLGEIPSIGYLGIGLGLISSLPFIGSFLLGVAVFGGKTVNIAFAAPVILAFTLWPSRTSAKNRMKYSAGFLTPLLLWILVIFLCVGPTRTLDWFLGYKAMLVQFLGVAKGTQAQIVHVPFFQRFSSSALEWVGYPRLEKLKILVFLFFPILYFFYDLCKERRLKSPIPLSLVLGLMIFSVWYFCIHPYMWIRHVQPALIVGFGMISWYFISFFLAQKPNVRLIMSIGLLSLFVFKVVKIF